MRARPYRTATAIARVRLGAWPRAIALLLAALTALVASVPALAATEPVKTDPIPVLAYYYIWFDPTSWDRAKTDYPLLGRYSSDDRAVMQQHIRWAKQAGINGFIVSWKSMPKLNRRLEQLIELAETENFKLLIIYQGLDFEREPIPVEKVARDLDYFVYRWGNHPAFDLFGRPVVIWSGTWEFSVEEIASVTERFRDRIYILASERNLEGYQRLRHLVDGNAYYWSSVNPDTYPGYEEKLQEMGDAVHADGGLWIAPAAPGFDARLIGGTRVVERKDGETLKREFAAALSSSPDAIGLISWNEFSENSHIEPSEKYGARYLEVLAQIRGLPAPDVGNFDSDAPAATGAGYGLPMIGAMVLLLIASLAAIVWREAYRRKQPVDSGRRNTTDETAADLL
ncbi:endo-1,3-alpha-glucanase family glycosylhydrolase [Thermalbibacter longus]